MLIAPPPKQLPPTRFFESAVARSEDEEIETDQQLFESQQGEIEDLLGAALNLEIQECYLDVHYRSRNSDLIQFSNANFYGSRLQAIPGHPKNRTRYSPVTLYRVNGTYEKRRNIAEANQVCQIVRDLLKRADPPSIGIGCFNLPQRDLIVDTLDEMAGQDADFARRFEVARRREGTGSFEGLFVKNLENVQGDERDHLIISTTYGPDPSGKFHRRFGPVGNVGGGRRLASDAVDPAVGFTELAGLGVEVSAGAPLARVHARDAASAEAAIARLRAAYRLGDKPPSRATVVERIIGRRS